MEGRIEVFNATTFIVKFLITISSRTLEIMHPLIADKKCYAVGEKITYLKAIVSLSLAPISN